MRPQNIITKFVKLSFRIHSTQKGLNAVEANSAEHQRLLSLSKRLEKEFESFSEKYADFLELSYTENLVNSEDQCPPLLFLPACKQESLF